jgi:hypothetical protein
MDDEDVVTGTYDFLDDTSSYESCAAQHDDAQHRPLAYGVNQREDG